MKITVSGLWIGPSLSKIEQLSIKSFLNKGYDYNLYTYEKVENIPDGVTIKDANEILPKSEVFAYKNKSFSAVSNIFRFKLLYKKNAIWVDLDIICTKFYDFNKDKYLFVSEPDKNYEEDKLGSCIIKMPKNDIICFDAIEKCKREKEKVLKGEIVWGIGPRAVKYIVEKYALQKYVKPWRFSASCANKHFESLINPEFNEKGEYFNKVEDIPQENYFIHLWHEFLRKNEVDKNNLPKNSFISQLEKSILTIQEPSKQPIKEQEKFEEPEEKEESEELEISEEPENSQGSESAYESNEES